MTKINIESGKKNILVKAEGHSGYAEEGFDIVCAGISALLIAFARAVGCKLIAERIRSGDFFVECRRTKKTRHALEMLILGLKFIQDSYPENLKLKY